MTLIHTIFITSLLFIDTAKSFNVKRQIVFPDDDYREPERDIMSRYRSFNDRPVFSARPLHQNSFGGFNYDRNPFLSGFSGQFDRNQQFGEQNKGFRSQNQNYGQNQGFGHNQGFSPQNLGFSPQNQGFGRNQAFLSQSPGFQSQNQGIQQQNQQNILQNQQNLPSLQNNQQSLQQAGNQQPEASTTTTSTQVQACLDRCVESTPNHYNPSCSTDNMTIYNEEKLNCAVDCGQNIQVKHRGACPRPTIPPWQRQNRNF